MQQSTTEDQPTGVPSDPESEGGEEYALPIADHDGGPDQYDEGRGDEAPADTHGLVWSSALRYTLKLLPAPTEEDSVRILLNSEGQTDADILPRLAFQPRRSRPTVGGGPTAAVPDARRLRDPRDVARMVGLLYRDDEHRYRVTELGVAVRRWLPNLTTNNWPVLGRHAAYALAACQLRNPIGGGKRVAAGTEVFPFAFIWRAMLALDGAISSDEMNRAIMRTHDEQSLVEAIDRIRRRRATDGPLADLGPEVVTGTAKNDRIIPIVSLASFGWTFIETKDSAGYYRLRAGAERLLAGASRARTPHREFATDVAYVRYLSDCACLPRDLR